MLVFLFLSTQIFFITVVAIQEVAHPKAHFLLKLGLDFIIFNLLY